MNPNLNNKKLIKFCNDRDIKITAYSPFGSPSRPWAKPNDPILSFDDPKLLKIAQKYDKTVPQIILRYLIDINCIPIPKSSNKQRIAENIDVFDFKLTDDDIKVVDSFNCNGRAVPADDLKTFPHYPFNDEF